MAVKSPYHAQFLNKAVIRIILMVFQNCQYMVQITERIQVIRLCRFRYAVDDCTGFRTIDTVDVFWRAFFLIFVAMIPYNQRCIFMRFYRISMHYRKFKDAFAPLTRLKSLTLR